MRPRRAKGYDDLPKTPPDPPRDISERELAWALRELNKAGWTLIHSPVTRWWKPARML